MVRGRFSHYIWVSSLAAEREIVALQGAVRLCGFPPNIFIFILFLVKIPIYILYNKYVRLITINKIKLFAYYNKHYGSVIQW